MKNLAKIFTAIVVAFAAYSCVADATEDLGVQIGNGEGQTTLTLSLEESRTQLGEKADGIYPLYWSEGDAIAVNGQVSNALTAEQAGYASATFTIEPAATFPYSITYPAPVAVAAEEEGEGEPTTTPAVPSVVFLAEQTYTEGTFCAGAAPMYAYATEEGPIQMQHLTGVLRIAVKGEGVTLRHLVITAEDGKIAGPFTVDCTTGALTAGEEATNSIKVSFGKGLQLKGDEATPIYVAVPAGTHCKFTLLLSSTTDIMKLSFDSAVKPVTAGKVREFTEFTYQANATEEDIFLINSKDALIQFAEKAANFAPYTTAKVVDSIDMTGVEWTPIEGFGAYTFDGGNFEIKGLSAPLFGATAASIRNVKLADVAMEITEGAYSGAIACELYGGSLVNCSATGAININNTTLADAISNNYNGVVHGGLVGFASVATIKNCTNDIDITITSLGAETLEKKASVGGVVGGVSNNCYIDNLTNNGNVTFVGETQKANLYISGVVGKNDDSSGVDFVAFNNCTNTGAISTAEGSISAGETMLSGITGRLEITADTVCDKLVNTGAITHNGEAKAVRLAGVVASQAKGTFTNCSNSGDIAITTGAKATYTYMAGVIAGIVTTDKVDNCSNSGDITIGDGLEFAGAVQLAGIACTVYNDTAKNEQAIVSNCTNSGALYCGNSTNTTTGNGGRLYLAPIIGGLHDAEMSNCTNEATGTMTLKTGEWASRYMIGGVAAYVGVNDADVTLTSVTDCENKAAIVVEPVGDVHSAQIGGITCEAYINKQKDTYKVNYLRVKNSGDISVKGTYTAAFPYLGGFLGVNNHDNITIKDCENSGDVNFSGTSVNARIGGFIGYDGNNNSFRIDGCKNSGNVTFNSLVTKDLYVGGIIGHCDPDCAENVEIKNTTNEGNITAISQTLEGTTYLYRIGGILGNVKCANLVLTNCTNGSATDATKGAITVGNTPAGEGLGGIIGYSELKTTLTGCKNYGHIKQDGFGGASKSARASIGGILGACPVGGLTITNCENHGTLEYHKPSAIKDARTDIAGIVSITNGSSNVIKGCKNGGTILYKAVKTNAGEVTVAGIIGCPQTGTLIEDCENTSTGLVHGAGATPSGYDVGGIGGGPSGSNVIFKNCKNYGEVKQSGALGGSMFIGGICGYGYAVKGYEDCENHGPITIGNTNTKAVHAGGIVGYARIASGNGTAVEERYMKNCANYYDLTFTGKGGTYYAGGVAGYIRNDDADMLWGEISGLKNIANITFACTASTPAFGGLAGAVNAATNCPVGALANITNCVSYGNIKAIGFEGKVGMFVGVARTADTYVVTNSQAGGNLIFAQEEGTDDDGNPTVTETLTPLTEENWFNYIYNTAVTEDVATADGCSLLTAKPAL